MQKILFSKDGTKISYQYYNKGSKWLLLLHGIDKSSIMWEKEIKLLLGQGFSVIAPDLRGHGNSDKPSDKNMYFTEKLIDDIDFILKKEKINNITTIGHSFGGALSVLFYEKYFKKVKSMILVNTDYAVPYHLYALYKFAHIFATKKAPTYCLEGAMAYMKDKNPLEIMSTVNVPVLLLHATKDIVCTPKHMETMNHFIKTGNLKNINATHNNIWKKEVANYYVLKFLKSNLVKATYTIFLAVILSILSTPGIYQGGITGAVVGLENSIMIDFPMLAIKFFIIGLILYLAIYRKK